MKPAISILSLLAMLILGCRESEPDSSDSVIVEESVAVEEPVPSESEAGEQGPDLDDPKVKGQIVAKAQFVASLQLRRGPNGERSKYFQGEPYTGWSKSVGTGRTEGELWLQGWKGGKQDGPAISWHKSGTKSVESHYKDGKMEGPWTGWYEGGQKRAEFTYKDGKLNGPYTKWHKNGGKEEGTYKDGKWDGVRTLWSPSGELLFKTTWKNGVEAME